MKNGQTRYIVSSEDFEKFLGRLPTFGEPIQQYEQYNTPITLIKRLLQIVELNDIEFSKMLDLGCGVGRIGLAFAKYYPSAQIIGIDISPQAVLSAVKFRKQEKLSNIQFIVTPLEFFETSYYHKLHYKHSIVVMNPPFGVYHKGIDMLFLRKALECAKNVIGIFKSHPSLRTILNREISAFNAHLEVYKDVFPIKKQPKYEKHKKPIHNVEIDICYFSR
ncbi:MAG: METTL5 family protein [Candidatus Hermodarchaeota archaeon]